MDADLVRYKTRYNGINLKSGLEDDAKADGTVRGAPNRCDTIKTLEGDTERFKR